MPTEMKVQEKKEHSIDEERTEAGRYYVPYTDIHESHDVLFVCMEMPGVEKDDVEIHLEKDVVTVTGKVDFSHYEGLEPVYTEYNVGNYTRSFTLSKRIDQNAIAATMEDGLLQLTLPKLKEAGAKKITIG